MSKKLTNEEFIEGCKIKHCNRYTYNNTNYINMHTNIIVTCKKHGDFEIKAYSHSRGNNCFKCYEEERNNRIAPIKYNLQTFISECNKVHNFKFKYNKTIFYKLSDYIIIICPKHGEISVNAGTHLRGHDCFKCSKDKQSENQTIDIIENIEKFNLKHDFKYDYSLIDLTKNYTSSDKVKIICKTHGMFEQQVSSHKNGNGCKKCGSSNSGNLIKIYSNDKEKGSKPGIFYKLIFEHKILGFKFLKVGITSKSIKERFKSYKDYKIIVVEEIKTTNLNSAILEQNFKNECKLKKFIFMSKKFKS
jgi:hypothetical protein